MIFVKESDPYGKGSETFCRRKNKFPIQKEFLPSVEGKKNSLYNFSPYVDALNSLSRMYKKTTFVYYEKQKKIYSRSIFDGLIEKEIIPFTGKVRIIPSLEGPESFNEEGSLEERRDIWSVKRGESSEIDGSDLTRTSSDLTVF